MRGSSWGKSTIDLFWHQSLWVLPCVAARLLFFALSAAALSLSGPIVNARFKLVVWRCNFTLSGPYSLSRNASAAAMR
jgi:hypothetical protein